MKKNKLCKIYKTRYVLVVNVLTNLGYREDVYLLDRRNEIFGIIDTYDDEYEFYNLYFLGTQVI